MRKVTFRAAASLDGYLAGPGEALDWLRMSEDAQAIMAESWKGVDPILMGRKTWEFAARKSGGAAPEGITTYVFSRTMSEPPAGAKLVREEAVDFVRELKDREGGDVMVMGGGELGSALIEGAVVDEIGLNIHPLLLGAGTPLFRPLSRRVELGLIEARPIARGCLYVRYRVVNHAEARRA